MNPEEQQAKIAIQDLQFRLFVRGIEEVIQFECRDLYGSCFFRFVWIPRGSVYYDLPRFYGGHRLQWFWKSEEQALAPHRPCLRRSLMFAGHAAIFRLMTQASPHAQTRSPVESPRSQAEWDLAALVTAYMPYDCHHSDLFWPRSPPVGRGEWSDYWNDNLF